MYYPFFLSYILIGLTIGLVVFIWALKSGQFTDQQRARFLPIEDENQDVIQHAEKGKYEIYLVFFLILAGIVSSAAILVYALVSR